MRLMNSSESTSFSVELDELAEVDVAIAVDLVDHGGDLVGDLVAGLHRPRWLRAVGEAWWCKGTSAFGAGGGDWW
ncbi:hypothetical protein RHMOL_Rhmol03G0218600 [Rhododendron molle]|uniref:Uncharacterized protein n=1 Tax=Rhododendron molle TaxID=49168 RepID=A0ACC0PHI3_RHOML|nr:hypothetical protein RHMOL_Rhmol03G0218600 [Rhododendron molle]